MVEEQLWARGIRNPRVLDVMRTLPRHRFVPPSLHGQAYADRALPIAHGQTISQPLMVATMLEALELKPTDRVLEVGAGTGYQAALLGLLAARVIGVEIVEALARAAAERIAALGMDDHVQIVCADGRGGWPAEAPYDAIVVAAAAATVPEPLFAQLADDGRLLMPVGPPDLQRLVRYRKRADVIEREELGGCVFVPLVGQ